MLLTSRIIKFFCIISTTIKLISATSTFNTKVLIFIRCYNNIIAAAFSTSNCEWVFQFPVHFIIFSLFMVIIHMSLPLKIVILLVYEKTYKLRINLLSKQIIFIPSANRIIHNSLFKNLHNIYLIKSSF